MTKTIVKKPPQKIKVNKIKRSRKESLPKVDPARVRKYTEGIDKK